MCLFTNGIIRKYIEFAQYAVYFFWINESKENNDLTQCI